MTEMNRMEETEEKNGKEGELALAGKYITFKIDTRLLRAAYIACGSGTRWVFSAVRCFQPGLQLDGQVCSSMPLSALHMSSPQQSGVRGKPQGSKS
jgi:hypothetical protein